MHGSRLSTTRDIAPCPLGSARRGVPIAAPRRCSERKKVRDGEGAIGPSRTGDYTRGACAPQIREPAPALDCTYISTREMRRRPPGLSQGGRAIEKATDTVVTFFGKQVAYSQ